MYRKILLANLLTATLIVTTGCGSKQYFSPETTHNLSTQNTGDNIVYYSRDGATLASGKILTKDGSVGFKLANGFHFINKSQGLTISADDQGNCQVINNRGEASSIRFPKALIAGTIIGKQLVFLLQNNSFGIYDLERKSIVYSNKAEKAYAIDTRVANPLQVDNLVVIPTLDGKLTIVNLGTLKVVKEMYVSTESTLNNIIYLNRINNTLISATPHKVLTVSNQGKKELDIGVADVIVDGGSIFVFSKDGTIKKVSEALLVESEKKFRFAHFSTATVYNNRVYALDKQGYLIVSNKTFSKHKVYKLSKVDSYVFISNGKLYYNGEEIDLNQLNYE